MEPVLATIGSGVAILFGAIGLVTVFELASIGYKALRNTDPSLTVLQLLEGDMKQK